jgi:malate synthase
VHNGSTLSDGTTITPGLVREVVGSELAAIGEQVGETPYTSGEFEAARELFEKVALSDDFDDFLTLPAYDMVARR